MAPILIGAAFGASAYILANRARIVKRRQALQQAAFRKAAIEFQQGKAALLRASQKPPYVWQFTTEIQSIFYQAIADLQQAVGTYPNGLRETLTVGGLSGLYWATYGDAVTGFQILDKYFRSNSQVASRASWLRPRQFAPLG